MKLDPQQRALLGQLADVLIPAAGQLPSASQADVAGKWLDAVLTARPDLGEGLKQALDAASDAGASELVADWRAHQPTDFELLAEVVTNAYFMNPQVQQLIGYSGQDPRPMDPRADYMEDDLLASVIRRGAIYRPTPKVER